MIHRLPLVAFLSLACLAGAVRAQSPGQALGQTPVPSPRPLTADEQAGLRCSAAFALVAAGQARGDAASLRYPALGARGREFFVRTSARLMDDAGLDQAGVAAAARAEAAALRRAGVDPVMPFCLKLLDAALPPAR